MQVKSEISLDVSLFERVEVVAKELNVSRSRLFSLAIEDFLKRYDSKRLLEAINAAYSDSSDVEAQAIMRAMDRYRKQFAEEE